MWPTLETLLDALMPYVATTTSMVLSTALAWGNIVKPGGKAELRKLSKQGPEPGCSHFYLTNWNSTACFTFSLLVVPAINQKFLMYFAS